MAYDILETSEIIDVIRTFPPVSSYWLDLCFNRTHFSDSEFIDFDVIDKAKRLAPFVAPNVQGQPMLSRREDIKRFKPAYIKPKDPIDPARVLRRRQGEMLGGSLTPAQRHDAILADTFEDHRDGIYRRWEWMACQAIKDGMVTVYGENYPTRVVGFGRNAANTKTLSGGALWSAPTTATPLTDIKNWASEMLRRSGRRLARITMSTTASDAFFATDQVKAALETRRGSLTRLESHNVSGEYVVYHGDLEGGVSLYTYNDTYEDNDGDQVPFLEEGIIVLTGDVEGVRAFGAIMDAEAGWVPMALFPKMWMNQDPSGVFAMTQSAPLMIPGRPDASMKVRVIAA